jgi:hypothetical protein
MLSMVIGGEETAEKTVLKASEAPRPEPLKKKNPPVFAASR